jgi:hypothetical protein
VAAAVTESSSALPGADDVGDAGGSAWSGTRFRSVESGARFPSGSQDGERGGLTLGRFGGGAEAEGDGDGDVEAGRLAAELRRVSTIASRSPEAWRGFLSSSPLLSRGNFSASYTSEMEGFSFVWKFSILYRRISILFILVMRDAAWIYKDAISRFRVGHVCKYIMPCIRGVSFRKAIVI